MVLNNFLWLKLILKVKAIGIAEHPGYLVFASTAAILLKPLLLPFMKKKRNEAGELVVKGWLPIHSGCRDLGLRKRNLFLRKDTICLGE